MASTTKSNPVLSEPFLLLSLLATIILIVQDVNGILQMEVWGDVQLWFNLLKGTVRYFVVFLMGILSHLYKKLQEKVDQKNEISAAAINAEKQEIAVGYTRLRDLCLASNNMDLVSAAKDESMRIVAAGVDLFNVAQDREARLRQDQKEVKPQCPPTPKQPQQKLTPPQKP
jgi:hypothetical protein